MSTPGAAARIAPDALDLDRSLAPRSRRTVVLVHRVGDRWREVARFGSTREANMALDDHIADGARPDEYAVTTLPRTRRQVLRLAAEIVGGVVLVLVVSYLLVQFVIV